MKYVTAISQCLIFIIVLLAVGAAQPRNSAMESKISAMVKQMTLEEKVGQMAQVSIESLGGIQNGNFSFNQDKFRDAVVNYKIGSILNTPGLLNAGQWNG